MILVVSGRVAWWRLSSQRYCPRTSRCSPALDSHISDWIAQLPQSYKISYRLWFMSSFQVFSLVLCSMTDGITRHNGNIAIEIGWSVEQFWAGIFSKQTQDFGQPPYPIYFWSTGKDLTLNTIYGIVFGVTLIYSMIVFTKLIHSSSSAEMSEALILFSPDPPTPGKYRNLKFKLNMRAKPL